MLRYIQLVTMFYGKLHNYNYWKISATLSLFEIILIPVHSDLL